MWFTVANHLQRTVIRSNSNPWVQPQRRSREALVVPSRSAHLHSLYSFSREWCCIHISDQHQDSETSTSTSRWVLVRSIQIKSLRLDRLQIKRCQLDITSGWLQLQVTSWLQLQVKSPTSTAWAHQSHHHLNSCNDQWVVLFYTHQEDTDRSRVKNPIQVTVRARPKPT